MKLICWRPDCLAVRRFVVVLVCFVVDLFSCFDCFVLGVVCVSLFGFVIGICVSLCRCFGDLFSRCVFGALWVCCDVVLFCRCCVAVLGMSCVWFVVFLFFVVVDVWVCVVVLCCCVVCCSVAVSPHNWFTFVSL